MQLPWTDWQFWLVTAAAVGALAIVVRPFLPRRRGEDAPCAHCAVGTATRAATLRRQNAQH